MTNGWIDIKNTDMMLIEGGNTAARVVFGWISALDQHHVGVADVDPAVRHCPASEGRSQT